MNRADLRRLAYCPPRANRSPSAQVLDESPLSAYGHPRLAGRPPCSAGGLRLTRGGAAGRPGESFAHVPVMADEVVETFSVTPPGLLIDATVGGGGHAAAILSSRNDVVLLGIDRDPEALSATGQTLQPFGARARLVAARFDRLEEVVASRAGHEPVIGVLFDLGVSSWQFDSPERGFSYRFEGPLDMRMNRADPVTAAEIVNTWPAAELARIFASSGESRFAGRIARSIESRRPLHTTSELADAVRSAIPAAARRGGGHPAKRVFQALRIAVNEEIDQLGPAVDTAIRLLVPGGRIVVLSYHSGEDKLAKQRLQAAATGWCSCPSGLPCVCGAVPAVRLLNRGARLASREEVARNPRSASARFRAAERLPRGQSDDEDPAGEGGEP